MSSSDESDHLRQIVHRIFENANKELDMSRDTLRQLLVKPHTMRTAAENVCYLQLATIADAAMNRRPLAFGVVDGFYKQSYGKRKGEQLFVNGMKALRMHGYPAKVIANLPTHVTSSFFGLGNVWDGIGAVAGKRVIDVGCGAGVDLAVAWHLSGRSATVIGVDTRPELLTIAAAACPTAQLWVGDVRTLGQVGGDYDVVVANGLPPLQRLETLHDTALSLSTLTANGGLISATVIATAPNLVCKLRTILSDNDDDFVRALAVFITGKPSVADFENAFTTADCTITMRKSLNPYLSSAVRRRTELFNALAWRKTGN